MPAAQQCPIYNFVVSPEEAERGQQVEAARKMASKDAKAAKTKYAEALRLDRARDKERDAAESAPSVSAPTNVVALPRRPVVLHTPTDAEVAALRADVARREEVRLKAFRRTEAERAKTNLLRWAEKKKPAISLFIEEVLAALFVHVRDERNAGVYSCEGVEIRAFGAAVEAAPRNTKRVSRLSDEQQRAANRRSRNKASLNTSWTGVEIMTTEVAKPARTAEERAAAKARNIEKAARVKAAKDAAQAAYKLAHPKAKKAPVAKAKNDKGEEKKKGGK